MMIISSLIAARGEWGGGGKTGGRVGKGRGSVGVDVKCGAGLVEDVV